MDGTTLDIGARVTLRCDRVFKDLREINLRYLYATGAHGTAGLPRQDDTFIDDAALFIAK